MSTKCHKCGKEIPYTEPSDDWEYYCSECGEEEIKKAISDEVGITELNFDNVPNGTIIA